MKITEQKCRIYEQQIGFSIAELLIAMVLMLIVFASVFSLLQGSIVTANANTEMGDAKQSLRNAQEYIARDLMTAGDGLRGIGTVYLPTGFVTERLTTRSAATVDPTASGYVDIGAFVSDDNIAGGTPIINSNPAVNFLGASDRISLLSVDPTFVPITIPAGGTNFGVSSIDVPPASIGQFQLGEIYFISSGTNSAFGTITEINGAGAKIFWKNGDAYGINRSGSNGTLAHVAAPPDPSQPSLPSMLLRMQIIQYFVDQQGKLIRRAYGVKGAGFADSIIAEHVNSLQFRYSLRPNGSSAQIYENPTSNIAIGDQGRVRLVDLWASVDTANPLYDGARHSVDGSVHVGIRNMQFSESAMPR
jgi:type II secretory pathway pseudopilin PulG